MIKLFHQIIYYIIVIPVSLGLIVSVLVRSDHNSNSDYHSCNRFLNRVKGKYQEIGT